MELGKGADPGNIRPPEPAGGGLEVVPSKKHGDPGLRKLSESGGDWSKLTGKQQRAVGVFLHKVMEGLVANLASKGWLKVHRELLTPAKIAQWRKAGKRVVLVESRFAQRGRMPRLDIAEIDFAKGKIDLFDYVPTSTAEHAAKTAAYGKELKS